MRKTDPPPRNSHATLVRNRLGRCLLVKPDREVDTHEHISSLELSPGNDLNSTFGMIEVTGGGNADHGHFFPPNVKRAFPFTPHIVRPQFNLGVRRRACFIIERALREFANGEPGRRFEERYWRRRSAEHSGAKRMVGFVAGILLLALGLFFAIAPAPGMLLLPGAGLIAQESLVVARTLDRIERRSRRAFG